VVLDLSTAVYDALSAILPNDGRDPIQSVDVIEGWGVTLLVYVYSGISQQNAGAALVDAIHTIVGGVMQNRRHVVRIVWA
jgi:hypothetical protein